MREALARATEIYIATDPDREGESIAWHIQQTLRIRDYKRIAFNEVTQSRVKEALANPRKIDAQLVASQECRRVLDRLVGYLVTGELRRVLGLPTTAGRVQSVAVYLVVLRSARSATSRSFTTLAFACSSRTKRLVAPGRLTG